MAFFNNSKDVSSRTDGVPLSRGVSYSAATSSQHHTSDATTKPLTHLSKPMKRSTKNRHGHQNNSKVWNVHENLLNSEQLEEIIINNSVLYKASSSLLDRSVRVDSKNHLADCSQQSRILDDVLKSMIAPPHDATLTSTSGLNGSLRQCEVTAMENTIDVFYDCETTLSTTLCQNNDRTFVGLNGNHACALETNLSLNKSRYFDSNQTYLSLDECTTDDDDASTCSDTCPNLSPSCGSAETGHDSRVEPHADFTAASLTSEDKANQRVSTDSAGVHGSLDESLLYSSASDGDDACVYPDSSGSSSSGYSSSRGSNIQSLNESYLDLLRNDDSTDSTITGLVAGTRPRPPASAAYRVSVAKRRKLSRHSGNEGKRSIPSTVQKYRCSRLAL